MAIFTDSHHLGSLWWQSFKTRITSVVFDDSLSRQRSLRQSLMVVLFSKEPFAVAFGKNTAHTSKLWEKIWVLGRVHGMTFCSVQTSNKRCSVSPSLFGWWSSWEKRSPGRFWQLSRCTRVPAKTVLEQRHCSSFWSRGMRTLSPKSKMPVSGMRLLESSPQICWLAKMPLSNFHKTRTSNSETRPWKSAKGSFLYVFVCTQNWLYVRPFLPNFQTIPQSVRGSFLSQGPMQTVLAYYVDCRCYVASHPKPGVLRSMRWMWHVAIAGSTLDRPPETMMWWVEHMSSTLARNLSTNWTII